MKKNVWLVFVLVLLMTGCGYNRQFIDVDYNYTRAVIKELGDVEVTSWCDYEDGMVQLKDKNGRVYYTHGSNVIFMSK